MPLDSLKILHSMFDGRLNAQSTLVAMSIADYLSLTEQSEENLQIQRKIVSRKSYYDRLRKDLAVGGTIPPIVLAVAENTLIDHDDLGNPKAESLSRLTPASIYIVDGLQRTHHIRLLRDELHERPDEDTLLSRMLRIEIWTRISFPSILYRMMILNAAQTPMTLKHQLEIVNLHLIKMVEEHDSRFEVFTDRERRRRFGPRQFQGADLVEGFTAFIKRTPLIDTRALILDELDQDDFVANFNQRKYQDDIGGFIRFLGAFDEAVCNRYKDSVPGASDEVHSVQRGWNFLGAKPYLLGFCAAAGYATSRLEPEEFRTRTARLIDLVQTSDEDPLAFARFHQLLPAIQGAGKIGDAQREFVFYAFRRYLLDESTAPKFDDCWHDAARRI